MRITCKSSGNIDFSKSVVGLIVYSIGTYEAKKIHGNNIYPGWILLVDDRECKAAENSSKFGTYHGKACNYFFKL